MNLKREKKKKKAALKVEAVNTILSMTAED
jgi:hypothetical protein